MSQSNTSGNSVELLPLIETLWPWRYILIGVTVVAAVATFGLTKLVTPLYEAHTVLYPSNTSSRGKQLEDFSFGFEIHSERLIQLLNSNRIMDSLAVRFNLPAHYEIDTQKPDGQDRYLRTAHENIQFHKTRYSSVVISVIDKDPELAAKLANEVARLVNVVNSDIVKASAQEALQTVQEEYRTRLGTISEMDDSITTIQVSNASLAFGKVEGQIQKHNETITTVRTELDRLRKAYKIYDYSDQVNVLNEQLADARSLYLQESGNLEVLETDKYTPDSIRIRSKARQSGAKMRVDYFQAQLDSLTAINERYTHLTEVLEKERKLKLEAELELERLQHDVEPRVHTRGLQSMERNYDWDHVQMQEIKRKYQNALANYVDPAPIAYVINYARPSYRKVHPNTMLNMAMGTIGTLLFAIFLILFTERIRNGGKA